MEGEELAKESMKAGRKMGFGFCLVEVIGLGLLVVVVVVGLGLLVEVVGCGCCCCCCCHERPAWRLGEVSEGVTQRSFDSVWSTQESSCCLKICRKSFKLLCHFVLTELSIDLPHAATYGALVGIKPIYDNFFENTEPCISSVWLA